MCVCGPCGVRPCGSAPSQHNCHVLRVPFAIAASAFVVDGRRLITGPRLHRVKVGFLACRATHARTHTHAPNMHTTYGHGKQQASDGSIHCMRVGWTGLAFRQGLNPQRWPLMCGDLRLQTARVMRAGGGQEEGGFTSAFVLASDCNTHTHTHREKFSTSILSGYRHATNPPTQKQQYAVHTPWGSGFFCGQEYEGLWVCAGLPRSKML